MSVYTSPAQLMAKTEKRVRLQVHSMRELHRYLYREGGKDHFDATNGTLSTNDLKAAGHPFGRKFSGDTSTGARGIVNASAVGRLSAKGQTYSRSYTDKKGRTRTQTTRQVTKRTVKPLPINRQTGRLRASFFATNESGPNRTVDMGFAEEYAKFVLSPTGTQFMTARGFYGKSTAALGIIAKRHRSRIVAARKVARTKYLIP